MTARLNVNIDHIATLRQARRAPEPSVVAAAVICESAGADGITVHLRGDRRHIQDRDIHLLRQSVTSYLNLEMASTEEILKIALQEKPDAVTLVAENPEEITTEGGLDVNASLAIVRATVSRLRQEGILASLFVDPDVHQIEAAHSVEAQQVELCTSAYAQSTLSGRALHGERCVARWSGTPPAARGRDSRGSVWFAVAAGHGPYLSQRGRSGADQRNH
jgi:pyridoxine 5-phosphate synthase